MHRGAGLSISIKVYCMTNPSFLTIPLILYVMPVCSAFRVGKVQFLVTSILQTLNPCVSIAKSFSVAVIEVELRLSVMNPAKQDCRPRAVRSMAPSKKDAGGNCVVLPLLLS